MFDPSLVILTYQTGHNIVAGKTVHNVILSRSVICEHVYCVQESRAVSFTFFTPQVLFDAFSTGRPYFFLSCLLLPLSTSSHLRPALSCLWRVSSVPPCLYLSTHTLTRGLPLLFSRVEKPHLYRSLRQLWFSCVADSWLSKGLYPCSFGMFLLRLLSSGGGRDRGLGGRMVLLGPSRIFAVEQPTGGVTSRSSCVAGPWRFFDKSSSGALGGLFEVVNPDSALPGASWLRDLRNLRKTEYEQQQYGHLFPPSPDPDVVLAPPTPSC